GKRARNLAHLAARRRHVRGFLRHDAEIERIIRRLAAAGRADIGRLVARLIVERWRGRDRAARAERTGHAGRIRIHVRVERIAAPGAARLRYGLGLDHGLLRVGLRRRIGLLLRVALRRRCVLWLGSGWARRHGLRRAGGARQLLLELLIAVLQPLELPGELAPLGFPPVW